MTLPPIESRITTGNVIATLTSLLGLVTAIVAVSIAYADLRAHRDYTREQMGKLESRIEKSETQQRNLGESLARMEGDIRYIRQAFERGLQPPR